MWHRVGSFFAAIALVSATGAGFAGDLVADPPQASPPKLVVVSWDGAADWVVDRLLAQGKLPHLAALAQRGARAEHSLSSTPSKTATAHAALWTGCWADCNSITGNSVPLVPTAEHHPFESGRGFSSQVLTAEPLYLTAARAGRSVTVLSATHAYPPGPYLEALRRSGVDPKRFRAFSGFEHRMAREQLLDRDDFSPPEQPWEGVESVGDRFLAARTEIAGEAFDLLAYDAPDDPIDGFDRLLVRQGSRRPGAARATAILTPRAAGDDRSGWSQAFEVSDGSRIASAYFRLFELAPDGSRIALYRRRVSAVLGSASDEDLAAYRAAYPGFHDTAFGIYQRGGLGARLADGGDGTAEERVLEIVAFDVDLLIRGSRWVLETWNPDVLFHYSPATDGAGHAWMGIIDPQSPRYDERLAAQLWPRYVEIYRHLDRWLGEIVKAAGDDTVIALVSDHGMAGVGRRIGVNRLLHRAGLLELTAEGGIDPAKSRAFAPPWGDFFVVVNDQRWRTGIVEPSQRRAVVAAVRKALLSATDPATGEPLIERTFDPLAFPDLGLGGPTGGDLYFDPAPGYYPDSSQLDTAVRSLDRSGSGEHGFWPHRRSMHAIFFVGGRGVRRGVEVPPVRHIDVAPTLSRLIGIPAPASARGRVISEMMESTDER